jgi:hypothetical protein
MTSFENTKISNLHKVKGKSYVTLYLISLPSYLHLSLSILLSRSPKALPIYHLSITPTVSPLTHVVLTFLSCLPQSRNSRCQSDVTLSTASSSSDRSTPSSFLKARSPASHTSSDRSAPSYFALSSLTSSSRLDHGFLRLHTLPFDLTGQSFPFRTSTSFGLLPTLPRCNPIDFIATSLIGMRVQARSRPHAIR